MLAKEHWLKLCGSRKVKYLPTDSDFVWASDAIERIERIFRYDNSIGAISGHGRALNGNKNNNKNSRFLDGGQFSIRKAFESIFGAVSCIRSISCLRKEAIFNFIPAWENDMFLVKNLNSRLIEQ
jgi:hypothetical protein